MGKTSSLYREDVFLVSGRLYIGTGDDALCDLIHVNGRVASIECDYKSTYYLRTYIYCPKGICSGFQSYTLGGTYFDGTYYYPAYRVSFTSASSSTTGYHYDLSLYYVTLFYINADNKSTTCTYFGPDTTTSVYSLTVV